MAEMTNEELLKALDIAERNYAHWDKQTNKVFPPYGAEDNYEYWAEKVHKLRKILDKKLENL